jgi:hypothetical protein
MLPGMVEVRQEERERSRGLQKEKWRSEDEKFGFIG